MKSDLVRLPCLLRRDGYARRSLRTGTTQARMRWQLRDRAFDHVLCWVEGAADACGTFGRGRIGSACYGDRALDGHAGARENRIGLPRIEADADGEPAHDLGEIPGRVVRRD